MNDLTPRAQRLLNFVAILLPQDPQKITHQDLSRVMPMQSAAIILSEDGSHEDWRAFIALGDLLMGMTCGLTERGAA